MKDELEHFVGRHREEFDIHTPPRLPFGRQNPIRQARIRRLRLVVLQAAAIIIVFLGSYLLQVYYPLQVVNFDFTPGNNINKHIPELIEAEAYYQSQVNIKLTIVRKQLRDYPHLATGIDRDLNELDSIYSVLKNDLREGIASQEVIEAMIENNRMKLQILEEMLIILNANDSIRNRDDIGEYQL